MISHKHRLLATAAHVANLTPDGEKSIAIQNETGVAYRVFGVWYHPSILRESDEGLFSVSDDPTDGKISFSSPNVAILRLLGGDAALPKKCVLATEEELRSLDGKRIGSLGFDGARDHRSPCTYVEGAVDGLLADDDQHRADDAHRYAFEDVDSCLKLTGYRHDVRELILGYAVVYKALARSDLPLIAEIVKGLSGSIDSAPAETDGAWKAEMTNPRAYYWEVLGEFDKSDSDHDAPIRLDSAERRWRVERVDFLARRGRHREAAEERAATQAPSRS